MEAGPAPKRKGRPPGRILRTTESEEKEKRRNWMRAWRSRNQSRYREHNRASYRRHKAERMAQKKLPHMVARRLELYQKRKKEIVARKCELMKTPKYRARASAYLRRRRRESPQFALADAMRATMNRAFRRNWIRKPMRTEALLGCTIPELKAWIESQFSVGMCWEMRSSFVVDHVVPVVAFDLSEREEASLAFNWKNLKPITFHENAVKSGRIPDPLPDWIPGHIAARIKARRPVRLDSTPFSTELSAHSSSPAQPLA